MNILILSAGGPTAHGVIKSLRDINFDGKIISVDSNPLSAGFYLSDSYHTVPKAFDNNYIDKLLQIVKDENIDLILPTSSNDIITISENSHLFDCKLFMSDYEAIDICSDKLKFYEKCKDKFPLPKTSINYNDIDFPIFAKPKEHSAGSRGISLCESVDNINCLNQNKFKYIYQEYLPGMEYTIDVLCDMDSNPLVAVPRERLQTKAGISSKGRIVKNNFIEKSCFEICKFLKLKGPLCLQMKEDINGNPKFVEINPRLGGSSYFATLAGINFLEIILDLVNGKKPIINKPKPITILRYYNEVVI